MAEGTQTHTEDLVDVVIVGGGAAGLSAALALGRVRRSAVVIDAGEPRNAPAAHMHGYLSRDGLPPRELLRLGRAEVEGYGVRVVDGTAVTATGTAADAFAVTMAGGEIVRGRKLVVTTGLGDDLPAIPGLRERWGRDVVHCPFCHGWEVKDRPLVVVGTGGMGVHAARVFSTISDDITVVVHDGASPSVEEIAALDALGVALLDGPVVEVVVEEDAVTGVRLADGSLLPAGAVVARGQIVARSPLLESLGLEAVDSPMGRTFPSGPMGASPVPGVWLAGNVTNPMASVIHAAAEGYSVGGAVHAGLLEDEVAAALGERAHP